MQSNVLARNTILGWEQAMNHDFIYNWRSFLDLFSLEIIHDSILWPNPLVLCAAYFQGNKYLLIKVRYKIGRAIFQWICVNNSPTTFFCRLFSTKCLSCSKCGNIWLLLLPKIYYHKFNSTSSGTLLSTTIIVPWLYIT